MGEISLAVTTPALEYAQGTREKERQISFRAASPDIARQLLAASAEHRVKLRLAEAITLIVGDTSAIWLAHNSQYADDFANLFAFLARYPSQHMRFLCEVVR